MSRVYLVAIMRALLLAVALLAPAEVVAQAWNDEAARRLVERAIRERVAAAADSNLVSYRARAHGTVLFLAEVGFGVGVPPKLLKADELDVEVYWERPDRSKQVIVAWRDSTFFPVAVSYHRDHLGIVSNDFGPMIRIGDGDEVAGVVHPLAPDGPSLYDYRTRDPVTITGPTGRIVVATLEFRPKDPGQPLAVGTLDLDLGRAQVVRSSLAFTPSAYRDRDLEDIAVRLERSLVDGRYWLPYAQEIEIRRRSAVVDFPVRGIIRGRWRIDDIRINDTAAVEWAGPAIAGLRRPGGPKWPGPMREPVDSAAGPGYRRVLEEVRAGAGRTLRGRLLTGLPSRRLGVIRFSDIARVTRVEGLRVGAGVAWHGGLGRLAFTAGLATSDGRLTGRAEFGRVIGGQTFTLVAEHSVVDLSEAPAVSGLVNSITAQEVGRDWGDYWLRDRIAVGTQWRNSWGALTADVGRDWGQSLATNARPARGSYRANPALGGGGYTFGRLAFRAGQRAIDGIGLAFDGSSEVGVASGGFVRIEASARWVAPVGGGTLNLLASGGMGTSNLPRRRSFVFGGPGTLPGVPFRGFGGRRMALAKLEWLVRVPGLSLPLGPFGRTSSTMMVGPTLGAGLAGGSMSGVPWRADGGVRPAAGVAVELFERTLRLEAGRGWRGGGWSVGLDFTRNWWPIL